jgi:hypothetical protein
MFPPSGGRMSRRIFQDIPGTLQTVGMGKTVDTTVLWRIDGQNKIRNRAAGHEGVRVFRLLLQDQQQQHIPGTPAQQLFPVCGRLQAYKFIMRMFFKRDNVAFYQQWALERRM